MSGADRAHGADHAQGAHRVHGPRKCKECLRVRRKANFTISQWAKSDKKRTCVECQDRGKVSMTTKSQPADVDCCICLEATSFSSRVFFDCTHWVCKDCVSELFLLGGAVLCPLCRSPVSPILMHAAVSVSV